MDEPYAWLAPIPGSVPPLPETEIPALLSKDLTKRFGDLVALQGLTLLVPRGVTFGLHGPNGAGKTTALRLWLGLAAPTSGTAFVLGRRIPPRDVLPRIGYMPQDAASERVAGLPPVGTIDAADLSASLRWFSVTLVLFIVLMAWFLFGFGIGFAVGVVPISFVSSYWIALLLPVVIPVFLGVSLLFAQRATRWGSEAIRLTVLGARASFYLGIGLVLESVPVFLAGAFNTHYGPSRYAVDVSTWIGLALLAPFLIGILVPLLRILRRMGDSRTRDRALLAVVGGSVALVVVPLVSLLVDSTWEPSYGGYWWTPPGFYIITVGVGLEAAFAFLVAVLLLAYGLALPAYRAHLGVSLALGLTTIALGVVSFFVLLGPITFSYADPIWSYFRVFGFEGIPWAMWGLVPSGLGMASAAFLLVALHGTDRSLPRMPVASSPESKAPIGGP